jgi:hypothetical protein
LTGGTGLGAGIRAAASEVGCGKVVEVGSTINSLGKGTATTAGVEGVCKFLNSTTKRVVNTIRLRSTK